MRLLLAEDERELARALEAIMAHNHYSVDVVHDGVDALDYGLHGQYNAIILDIMMPKKDGLEVLRALREGGVKTPVLMLTAKSQLEDKIDGLDHGADDYLTKPFATAELLARVRALTRRQVEYVPSALIYGNLTLDRGSFELKSENGSYRLGNKEFQMMEMLMTRPGQLISTEHFLEHIWGYDAEAEINVVWVYISYLRKKLRTLEANVEIKATRGVGYALEAKHD